MRFATWNVNSVKQRLPRLLPWLAERSPDVVCLQETKLADAAFDELLGDDEVLGHIGKHLEALGAKRVRRLDETEHIGLQGVGIADHLELDPMGGEDLARRTR